jgi:hypothetical protein
MHPKDLLLAAPVFFFASCASAPAEEVAPSGAPHHERPIVERDGRTLLWANETEWFDVTDATINPATFQYGIGKDRIA